MRKSPLNDENEAENGDGGGLRGIWDENQADEMRILKQMEAKAG